MGYTVAYIGRIQDRFWWRKAGRCRQMPADFSQPLPFLRVDGKAKDGRGACHGCVIRSGVYVGTRRLTSYGLVAPATRRARQLSDDISTSNAAAPAEMPHLHAGLTRLPSAER
jgi:hypothetical protein